MTAKYKKSPSMSIMAGVVFGENTVGVMLSPGEGDDLKFRLSVSAARLLMELLGVCIETLERDGK